MIDLTHFKQHGYQVLDHLIAPETIDSVADFLQSERDKTLAGISSGISYDSIDDLIRKAGALYQDPEQFQSLPRETQMALSGHFSLEARLSETLLLVPRLQEVQAVIRDALDAEAVRLHLPPTARFILPGNGVAAVPAHQDVSYNKQVADFVVLWVPFVDIDDACGGVVVHHGTGFLPEQQTGGGTFWLEGVESGASEKRHCTMSKGGALLLNKWIVHESRANQSERTRYSSDFRFFDARLESKKHALDLQTGERLEPVS